MTLPQFPRVVVIARCLTCGKRRRYEGKPESVHQAYMAFLALHRARGHTAYIVKKDERRHENEHK